jgi:tetratricopeptide (TPR) repeat protein
MSKKRQGTKEDRVLWYTGYNYFRKGEYEKARKFYNEAINKQHDETGYLMMGILNDKLKKYDEAIENFNKYAESSDKNKSIAYGYRGYTKLKLGLYNDAFDDFMLSIKLRTEQRKIEQNKYLNEFFKLIDTYKKIDLNNKDNKAVSIIKINKCFSDCIFYIEDNDFERAIEYLQKLLQMYPKLINPEKL